MDAPREFIKERKDLYQPGTMPAAIDVPEMTFLAVDGRGDPNEPEGEYGRALELLYALSYTIKMSEKSGHALPGYYEYRVPPLEGLWQMANGAPGVDYARKADFCWTSLIRQPEFVDEAAFIWAAAEVRRKKKLDVSSARLVRFCEGLCVQCMHIGPYDDEPATVARMDRWIAENGYKNDLNADRRHHEIYLGDPRRTAPEKRRTILRHPVIKL